MKRFLPFLLVFGLCFFLADSATYAQKKKVKGAKNKKIKKPKAKDKPTDRMAFPKTISGQTKVKRKNPVVGRSPRKKTGENFTPPRRPRSITGTTKVKRKDPIVGSSPRKKTGDNFIPPRRPRSITGTTRVERKDPVVGRSARKVEGANFIPSRPFRSISGQTKVTRKDPIVGSPPRAFETAIKYKRPKNKYQNITSGCAPLKYVRLRNKTSELSCGPKAYKRITNITSSMDCSQLYAKYMERSHTLKLDGKMAQDKYKVKKVKYDKKEGKIWYY